MASSSHGRAKVASLRQVDCAERADSLAATDLSDDFSARALDLLDQLKTLPGTTAVKNIVKTLCWLLCLAHPSCWLLCLAHPNVIDVSDSNLRLCKINSIMVWRSICE
jgi:hypothetical protein